MDGLRGRALAEEVVRELSDQELRAVAGGDGDLFEVEPLPDGHLVGVWTQPTGWQYI